MTEKKLQTDFIAWLKGKNIYNVKIVISARGGAPDVIACVAGRFVAFEFKSDKGRISVLQQYTAEKIKFSGGEHFFVNPQTVDDVKKRITDIIQPLFF